MHYKQNNKESKTYVQGLRPFGSTLPRGIKGILKKNGYNFSEIISKWTMLVGKDVANCSFPKSIKMNRGKSNGTLILLVKRGDEINVEYSRKEIVNKINSYFGYKLIDEIKLQAFSEKEKKMESVKTINRFNENYEKKIEEIKNKNIKNSLFKLLKSINNE